MRDALRACYEARIGQSLASCVRALRRQGFPQTYASNMQAARSMMASAAGTVLGSARHYAHTLDASLPPDAASASRQLLHAGLQQPAQDAELIMGLLALAGCRERRTDPARCRILAQGRGASLDSRRRLRWRWVPASSAPRRESRSAPAARRTALPHRADDAIVVALPAGGCLAVHPVVADRSLHRRAGPLPPRQRASPRRRAPA